MNVETSKTMSFIFLVTATELLPFALGTTWKGSDFCALILYTALPAILIYHTESVIYQKRRQNNNGHLMYFFLPLLEKESHF